LAVARIDAVGVELPDVDEQRRPDDPELQHRQ
jgi:hypothetical protein